MKYENPLLCVWKALSRDRDSTTFADVSERSSLYICKHYCHGFGTYKDKNGVVYKCNNYVPVGFLYRER